MDGVRSFKRPSAVKKLTKDYGGLHPETERDGNGRRIVGFYF
jgi:hypothetical protein